MGVVVSSLSQAQLGMKMRIQWPCESKGTEEQESCAY